MFSLAVATRVWQGAGPLMPSTALLAQVSTHAAEDLIPPYAGAQQPDIRCLTCDETLVSACGGDPQRQVCEWCLRDYQRQVLDRSPALRRVALPLFEAVLHAGRSLAESCTPHDAHAAIKEQNFAAWGLYRLGVDVGRRRVMHLDVNTGGRVRVRVIYGHSVERELMTLLAEQVPIADLLAKATTEWSSWPQLVSFAAEWGLAIRLPHTGRLPHYVTDHLVGDVLPDLAQVFAAPRSATLERAGSATITLRLNSAGTPAALALLFDNPSAACRYHRGTVTVSKLRRLITPNGWLAPAVELSMHLALLGFECDTLPVCGHLDALRPEPRIAPGSTPLDLQHALAHLGLVDTCQTQPSYLGYSRRHGGVVHVVLEAGTSDLLIEHGRTSARLKYHNNRQALADLRRCI